jgi:hypothetical protein
MGEKVEWAELDRRRANGIEVILHWVKDTIHTVVEVHDHAKPEHFTVEVPEGVSPNEVYMHPYAYREE